MGRWLALAAAGAVSNIELRSGNQTATIRWDGATLDVPQQCRASSCAEINANLTELRALVAANARFTESVRDAVF